jgi:hypothetical protein
MPIVLRKHNIAYFPVPKVDPLLKCIPNWNVPACSHLRPYWICSSGFLVAMAGAQLLANGHPDRVLPVPLTSGASPPLRAQASRGHIPRKALTDPRQLLFAPLGRDTVPFSSFQIGLCE